MVEQTCLGLLGLAGNYGRQNINEVKKCLQFVVKNFDLIDVSTDYGIEYNLIEILKNTNIQNSRSNFIYKVGCELKGSYSVKNLIKRTLSDIQVLGENNIDSILFHKPSYEKLDSDMKFFKELTRQMNNIKFGICCNNQALYNYYSQNIDIKILQLAINPLDYASNVSFLDDAKSNGVIIQARSILSSGLLSGKYNDRKKFSDPLRYKYNMEPMRDVFLQRMRVVNEIYEYFLYEYSILKQEMPEVLYSVFEQVPQIDIVIRGGSNFHQIKSNSRRRKIKNIDIVSIIQKMKHEWSCEYV